MITEYAHERTCLLPRVGEMDERRHDYVPGRGDDVPSRSEWLLTRRGGAQKVSREKGLDLLGLEKEDVGLWAPVLLWFVFALPRDFAPGMQDRLS